jgi:DNA-binding transcriptional ArsR family regulator
MTVKQSEQSDVVSVLQALADPVRLEMVNQLAGSEGELACGMFDLGVSKSTCTHHLKVLCGAGITAEREQGTRKFIRLNREELDERYPGLLGSVLRD